MIAAELLADGDYTLVRAALVHELDGDAAAAIVLQRIHWRTLGHGADTEGWWQGSYDTIAHETGLSRDQVKRAVKKLRDRDVLEAEERSGQAYDHTLSYRPAIGRIRPIE